MSTADWYARKLRAAESQPAPPITQPVFSMGTQTANSAQITMTGPLQPSSGPAQAPGCPNCGSPNYGKPAPNIAARCFDCAYGLPIQNTTQGLAAPSGAPATPAMQVPTAGYQPTNIVGRVG